ncbi:NUMOD3 domain-containing DNA-binding protein [Natronomonas sp. EA1]|uniref:HNH endonuclease n=1 Tax=Natronomonas sp. EA1 TaxID=3421655 RepID=UPI003EB761FB
MVRYRDASWLHEQYHDEGKTQREIAEECGVSPTTVRKWMSRHGIETREVAGENHGLYGQERDEDVKAKISETLEGREFDETWRGRLADARRGRTVEEETRRKISESLEGQAKSESTRQRMSEATRGERNPNWRGGYSERYGPGWALARERVQDRDGVCQHCGHDGDAVRLEVHHIIPVRVFRETAGVSLTDAHDPSNLVLLCRRCHPKADHGKLGFSSGIADPRGENGTQRRDEG